VNMAEIVQRMIEAGAPAAAVAVAVQALEGFRSLPEASGKATDYELAVWRKVERQRKSGNVKNLDETRANAKANDVAPSPEPPPENLPEASGSTVLRRCDDTSLSSLEGNQKKGRKRFENIRARGTRLGPDAALSEVGRNFAADHGVDPSEWSEFRDYWVSVPGQRGVKLDWEATWRNRVREIARRKNGKRTSGTSDLSDGLARLREFAASGHS
jgi:hypothetical protein